MYSIKNNYIFLQFNSEKLCINLFLTNILVIEIEGGGGGKLTEEKRIKEGY